MSLPLMMECNLIQYRGGDLCVSAQSLPPPKHPHTNAEDGSIAVALHTDSASCGGSELFYQELASEFWTSIKEGATDGPFLCVTGTPPKIGNSSPSSRRSSWTVKRPSWSSAASVGSEPTPREERSDNNSVGGESIRSSTSHKKKNRTSGGHKLSSSFVFKNIGLAKLSLSKYDEALTCFTKALISLQDAQERHQNTVDNCSSSERVGSNSEEEVDAQKLDIAELHTLIGTTLDKKGEIMEAILEFQTALKIRTLALGAYHADVGSTWNQIGLLQGKAGLINRAIKSLRMATKIAYSRQGKEGTAETTRNLAQCWFVLGSCHHQIGEYHKSMPMYVKSLELYDSLGGDATKDDLNLLHLRRRLQRCRSGYAKSVRQFWEDGSNI